MTPLVSQLWPQFMADPDFAASFGRVIVEHARMLRQERQVVVRVTLGLTPVWAATRSASRRSNSISCKNLVPWQTPMRIFWPVMLILHRSRKPLMGTPSRFISSISSRRAASSMEA